jgi:hypothetical protein
MDKPAAVYVLKTERINGEGHIVSQNVGVTFCIQEAEAHKGERFENEFDTLPFSGDVQEQSAQTELILAMRQIRTDIEESLK